MSYHVSTSVFEGPLDLLLQLITRHQVDVTAVKLTDLVTEYVAHLEEMRRLDLDVGEAADAPAAWLDLPACRLKRLEQRYRRVGLDAYDYRAPGVGYAATLQVSETGFVARYPGLWEMEALCGG